MIKITLLSAVLLVLSLASAQFPGSNQQAPSFNGLQYSQQGGAFGHYQQQANSIPTFGTPGVYNGHYATPEAFPQPSSAGQYSGHSPQQAQQPYNNHITVAQPQPQQQAQPANIPQQHQQQIASAFPNFPRESANAIASPPAGKSGASQLGINFSSAAQVSQLRFSGPGINFSY